MMAFFIVACVLLQAQRRHVLQKNSLHPAACLCEQHSLRLLASPPGQDHRQISRQGQAHLHQQRRPVRLPGSQRHLLFREVCNSNWIINFSVPRSCAFLTIFRSFEVLKTKIWPNFQRIIELFTKKIVKKLLKIWSLDPGSEIRKKPILDPGSGSATLIKNPFFCCCYWIWIRKK